MRGYRGYVSYLNEVSRGRGRRGSRLLRSLRTAVLALVAVLALPSSAAAATFVVTTGDDETTVPGCVPELAIPGCSLREAIAAAEADSGADTITFDSSLKDSTVAVTMSAASVYGPSAFTVSTPIAINGLAGDDGVTIARSSSAPAFRLFRVAATGSLTVRDLTLLGGRAHGGAGAKASPGGGGGGGAGMGGGIFNEGELVLTRSTLTDHHALGGAGGPVGFMGSYSTTGGGGGGSMSGPGSSPPTATWNTPQVEGGAGGPDGGGDGGMGGIGNELGAGENGGFGGGGGGAGHWGPRAGNGGVGGGGGGVSPGYGRPVASGGYGGGSGGHTWFATAGGGGGAGFGGAIFNYGGTVALTNSTLAGNRAQGASGGGGNHDQWGQPGHGEGAALFSMEAKRGETVVAGSVAIRSSTLARNHASARGGALLRHSGGDVTIENSIVSANTAGTSADIHGTYTDGGSNLVGTPAALATTGLGDYGGPTDTLAPGGPAIDAGATALTVDQRGRARPYDGDSDGTAVADVGAFELTGAIGLDEASYTATEGGGAAAVVVRRSGSSDGAASVRVTVSAAGSASGHDFTLTGPDGNAATVTEGRAHVTVGWAAGEGGAKTVAVGAADDAVDESDEALDVTLDEPKGGAALARANGTVSLIDNDTAAVNVVDAEAAEGDAGTTDASVDVRLSASTTEEVLVDLATADGSATAGSDYDAAIDGAERHNIALGKPATQTSEAHGGAAGRAVDGATDGEWAGGSVTHTGTEAQPYWQVDLGGSESIGQVALWPRVDCCQNQSANVWVLISDSPLPRELDAAKAQASFKFYVPGQIGRPTRIPAPVAGRYVRVQRADEIPLNLAEVQVINTAPIVRNAAEGKPSTQSSTAFHGFAQRGNDGNTNGDYGGHSVTHTGTEAQPYWQVDLGQQEQVDDVAVWPRTGCCASESSDLWVLVSDEPLPRELADARAAAAFSEFISGAAGTPSRVAVDTRGRYVRIQKADSVDLALAEVQVFTPPKVAFQPGQTQATVTVPVRGDRLDEPAETFRLDASRPGGAVLGDARGDVTIRDDDESPVAGADSGTTDSRTALELDVLANDTDADGDSLSISEFSQGTLGAVTSSGGKLTYTPQRAARGTDTFTYKASDGNGNEGSGTVSVRVTAAGNQGPAIAAVSDQSTAEDTARSTSVSVSDPDDADGDIGLSARATTNAELVESVSVSASGSGAERTVTVTPKADRSGTATIEVTAKDPDDATATRSYQLTVSAVNDAPVIAAIGDQSSDEDTAKSTSVSVSDIDNAAAELTLSGRAATNPALVESISFSGSGGERTVTVTPAADRFGTATIEITARDPGGATGTRSYQLTVDAVNDAPAIAAIADQATDEDRAKSTSVTLSDIDDEAAELTLAATAMSDPDGVVESISVSGSGAERTVTVTPKADRSGRATIELTAKDPDDATATRSYQLTVSAVNDAPAIAAIENQSTREDTPKETAITVSDVDNSTDEVTVSGEATTNAERVESVSVAGSGGERTVTVTPAADRSGPATIELKATNPDGAETKRSYELTIDPVNDAPVARDDQGRTTTGRPVTIEVARNDADVDGDPLRVTAASQPAHGHAACSGGACTYRSADGFVGSDSFTYTADDGHGGTATAKVTVFVAAGVQPAPVPPPHRDPPEPGLGGASTLRLDEDGYFTVQIRGCGDSRRCSGQVLFRLAERFERAGGTPSAAHVASKNRVATRHGARLAGRSFTLRAGRTKTIRLRASRPALRLLEGRGRVRTRATLDLRDRAGNRARRRYNRVLALPSAPLRVELAYGDRSGRCSRREVTATVAGRGVERLSFVEFILAGRPDAHGRARPFAHVLRIARGERLPAIWARALAGGASERVRPPEVIATCGKGRGGASR